MPYQDSKDIHPILAEFCRAVDEGDTPFLMQTMDPMAAIGISGLRVDSAWADGEPRCKVIDEKEEKMASQHRLSRPLFGSRSSWPLKPIDAP